ncbi:MAG: hypothetical protein KGL39_27765 [Patescibacteria group bacterium]|nr:hypothetical protein [Patescibacteria group bacterium]
MRTSTGTLGIHLLGSPCFVQDDLPLAQLHDRKLQALVFALCCHQAGSRSHFARLLWPNTNPERAAGNLRVRLHKLRQICPNLIETNSEGLRLSEGIQVDAWFLFEADEPAPLAVARNFLHKMILNGHSFEDMPSFNALLSTYRAIYERKSLLRLQEHAEELKSSGKRRECLIAAEEMLLISPFDEQACRTVMEINVLEHDIPSAIQTYLRFKANITQALGIGPDPSLTSLYEKLLASATARKP